MPKPMGAYSKNIKNPPRTLTESEQCKLLNATGQYKAHFRDHILISMALGTALREHELLALNIGDIYEGDTVRRRLTLHVFKRSSQNPAPQDVILPQILRTKLKHYYRWKKQLREPLDESAPLFLSRRKERLSARRVRELFHEWQDKAGFERRLSFHCLRHTACTNVYRKTKDLRVTQRVARHKSMLTTSIYTHPSDEDIVRAMIDLPC